MKVKLTIEADVSDDIAAQIKRNGCAINRSGSYMRLKIGNYLVAKDKAVIILISEDRKNAKEPQAVS